MDNQLFYEFFKKSPTAFSVQKVILDYKGIPCDYEYMQINPSYEKMMKVKESDLVGKRYSQVSHDGRKENIEIWMSAYREAVTYNRNVYIDISYKSVDKWLRINIIPIQDEYFASSFLEVTKEYLQEQEIEGFLHVNIDMLCVLDKEGHFIKENQEFTHVLGYEVGEFKGMKLYDFIHEDDIGMSRKVLRKLKARQAAVGIINRCRCKDGTYRHLSWRFQLRRQYIYASARDITTIIKKEEELRESEEKYRLMTENTSDVIWVFNTATRRFSFVSPSIFQLTGYTVEEVLVQPMEVRFEPRTLMEVNAIIKNRVFEFITNLDTKKSYITEVQRIGKDGSLVWTEDTTRYRFNKENEVEIVGVSRNIENRKRIEKEILFLSYHDQLTGLFNRYFMDRKINEEMMKSDRYNEPLSLAILDLDHFKNVNDTWGHPIGDEVLKQTAALIGNMIRETDTLARMGGEEFAVVMPNATIEGAMITAEKIRHAIEEYIFHTVGRITISIGVGERLKAESYINWYKRVDAALYRAKEEGRNRVVQSDLIEDLPLVAVQVQWKREWESGNLEIDNQHIELLNIGNHLISLSLSGEPTEKVAEQLELLLAHIDLHFRSEEWILETIGFPDFEVHAKIHNKLIRRAANLMGEYHRGELKASAFISFMLDDVIIGHLMEEDVKYFAYTQKKKE